MSLRINQGQFSKWIDDLTICRKSLRSYVPVVMAVGEEAKPNK